jgi:outer membrane receptor protein involved in Fe transport
MMIRAALKRVGTVCFSLLLIGLGASHARAQAIHEGKLTGSVIGPDGAVLPGATIEISSPALLAGKQSVTASARGTYTFFNLPVGRYTVVGSLTGFKTIVRENIDVSSGAVVSLDLMLTVGTVDEIVTVTASGPIVDTKTSTIDSRIDKDMLAKLPTSRDAFYDLSLTAPGMFDSSSSNSLPSPTAYGSPTNENVFLINGVNSTDPEAGSFGSLVNVNYDAVEEVRVVALGSKAEYGSFSGAAIDVLTKSGSNDLHGSAAFYSKLGTPASNQPAPGADLGAPFLYVGEGEQLAGETKSDWEGNATLGGPIVRDRLWFFGAFDYVKNASLPPRWSLENKSKGLYLDAKLSAAPFNQHRAWVSYHYEDNDSNGSSWGSQPAWDTSMSYGNAVRNHTLSGQWQWFSTGTTTASAKVLGFWKTDKPYLPADHAANPGYINWWKWADYGINGAFPYVDAQKASRQTVQADLSHYAEGFLGEHDIKFGVQYTKGRGNRQGGYFQNYVNFLYPYRWTQSVSEMQDYYGDTGLLFYNYRDTLAPFLTVRTADSTGLFFDDQWSLGKRLTLNVGLRYDQMTTKYGVGKVYQFLDSPAQINDPPPTVRDRIATDNIFDFKTFSPRIGLSYALTGDGKTVARAAYGRYYTPLSIEYLRRFGPDMPPVSRVYQLFEVPWDIADANGDGEIDTNETRNAARAVAGLSPISEEASTVDYSWTLNVADNMKDQFTDQLTLNLEREIAKNFSVSASYIYKHTGNLFANIPINRVTGQEWEYERVPFTTAGGQQLQLYSIVLKDYDGNGEIDGDDIQWISDNNTSRVQNMPAFDGIKPERNYHGAQIVFNKRYSNRWQALASFLYSSSSGMGRRTLRQDVNIEGPMFWDDNWMGSLNYTINNLEGPLPFTPKREVKLSGSYSIPKLEVDVGARFRMHSGRPMWLTESYPQHTPYGDPEGGVIDPGGLGRIVSVDEPTYLPTQTLLDLHLEKSLKLGNAKRALHLVVDGFNVFNSSTPTDMDIQFEYGKVTAIPTSRRFRFGARFEF